MLVFCECGQGNRVPWSSTVEEPPPEEKPPAPPPQENADRPAAGFPRPRRSRDRRRPDPAYCLNHGDTPKQAVCDACRCSFCSACLIELQGRTLCGPCKNFRLGRLSRPPRLTPLAIVSFVLALVCTLATLILSIIAISITIKLESSLVASLAFCILALIFAVSELIVSAMALRQIDRQPALGGRGLAMTGAMAGLTGVVWALSLAIFIVARQGQG